MNRRPLSEEEKRLWEQVTRHDTPLHDQKEVQVWREAEKAPKEMPMPVFSHTPVSYSSTPLTLGGYAGIDARTAERFRKGHYPIDAVLDLHGMSREKAHRALNAFIKAQYEDENRCLLVITGKGKAMSAGEAPRGVLRESLPHWLSEPGLKAMVLAFDFAQMRHGGSGAYYILLRRKR